AHNNQQMAFANTVEATWHGASYLDATMMGMGRGAGNCHLESLLSFLRNPKYKTIPLLKFIEEYIIPLREQGLTWGYDIPYMLTGELNAHPSFAIKFIKEGRKDYYNFFHELLDDTL
ncbi:MAG: nucleoid-structuring protein H-NS, partial [Oscillospiraceae bacterium]|nr:nucleoid-structuring protein H-NS [Oscillospiraceae bacterium]